MPVSTARTVTLVFSAAVVLATGRAHAFRTAKDLPAIASTAPVTWTTPRVPLNLAAGLPSSLDVDDVEAAVHEAALRWAEPSCSSLAFEYRGLTNAAASPDDGNNTIQFVEVDWTALGFDPSEAAVTDIAYVASSGGIWEIAEADVYVNAEHYSWALAPEVGVRDLAATLTHEFGHVVGILHPCELDGADGAPSCSGLPGTSDQVMYPLYDDARNALGDDDVAAVCYLHPSACADGTCQSPVPCSGEACPCEGADCEPEPAEEGSNPPGYATSAAPGDPCASDRGCGALVCAKEGYCLAPCDGVTSCDGTCDTIANPYVCRPEGLPGGAKCADASECMGGECIAGLTTYPVCTRACGGTGECPSSWYCKTVDGKDVCAPAESGAGCACGAARSTTSTTSLILLSAGLLFGASRWRTGRRHQQSSNSIGV